MSTDPDITPEAYAIASAIVKELCRRPTGYHEAGHAVACLALGYVATKADQHTRGGTCWHEFISDPADQLMVSMAGAVAARLAQQHRSDMSEDDMQSAAKAIEQVQKQRPEETLESVVHDYYRRTSI